MKFDASCFWCDRPDCISPRDWVTHPSNVQAMPSWTQDLLDLIGDLSKLTGRTFFRLKWLAERVGYSLRWVKEIISRLEKIGLISKIKSKLCHYSLIQAPPDSKPTAPQSIDIEPKSDKEEKPPSKYSLQICKLFAYHEARAGKVEDPERFAVWCWLKGIVDHRILGFCRARAELLVGG